MNITVAIDRGGELRITVRDDEIPAAERRLVQTFENALQVDIRKLLSRDLGAECFYCLVDRMEAEPLPKGEA